MALEIFGVKNFKLLHKKLVDGLNLDDSKDMQCFVACVKGKQTRSSFPKGPDNSATGLLALVHSNACGPM